MEKYEIGYDCLTLDALDTAMRLFKDKMGSEISHIWVNSNTKVCIDGLDLNDAEPNMTGLIGDIDGIRLYLSRNSKSYDFSLHTTSSSMTFILAGDIELDTLSDIARLVSLLNNNEMVCIDNHRIRLISKGQSFNFEGDANICINNVIMHLVQTERVDQALKDPAWLKFKRKYVEKK